MSTSKNERQARQLGMDATITRRDFVGGVLAGSALAAAQVSAESSPNALGPDWTGPGGIGDYRFSNGNTHEVVNAAHGVRDGHFDRAASFKAEDTGETYDLAVVGGGITGLMCAWEFHKQHGGTRRCLVLDNHRMFGGEAKGNIVRVGDYQLEGPQGSNAFIVPTSGVLKGYWDELQIPTQYDFQEPSATTTAVPIAREHYGPMLYAAERAGIGYWFRNELTGPTGQWHRDIWDNDLRDVPLPGHVKCDLVRWFRTEQIPTPPSEEGVAPDPSAFAHWLDTMSYADFIEKQLHLAPEVSRYVDPFVAVGISGTASDAISAYAAQRLLLPGVAAHSLLKIYEKASPITSPIGNGFIARYLVKALIPEAIVGQRQMSDVVRNEVRLQALDVKSSPTRIRLASTAVRVEHEGSPEDAKAVRITYVRNGKAFVVRARRTIMAGGGWVNRHVVRDLPAPIHEAYATFVNGPILTANVALTNWRFLDRLGISGARWFDGLGFFANVIQPMKLGHRDAPCHPDKPIMLTFYVPFLSPGLPARAQCAVGRARLFGTAYRDFELEIRNRMQSMFGAHGFNARSDIAGLILNRWGHAFICPQPGFYFGRDGEPAARERIRQGYGRIRFAHAELEGNQNINACATEAKRASEQVAALG